MYRALRYLKVGGRYIDSGEVTELKGIKKDEVEKLLADDVIAKVDEATLSSSDKGKEEKPTVKNTDEILDGELTDEEVRSELLEKITHTLAVKELKLLGAEFKANASLESLVELIMENEEYEDHFLDYIEQNEL